MLCRRLALAMFGIGLTELVVILVLAALVVGPEEMIQFAGQMGRWLAKFRRETEGVTREFKEAFNLELQPFNEIKNELTSDLQEVKAVQDDLAAIDLHSEIEGKRPATTPRGNWNLWSGTSIFGQPGSPQKACTSRATLAAAAARLPRASLSRAAPRPAVEAEPVVIDTSPDAEPISIGVAELVPEDAEVEPTIIGEPLWVDIPEEAVVEAVTESSPRESEGDEGRKAADAEEVA